MVFGVFLCFIERLAIGTEGAKKKKNQALAATKSFELVFFFSLSLIFLVALFLWMVFFYLMCRGVIFVSVRSLILCRRFIYATIDKTILLDVHPSSSSSSFFVCWKIIQINFLSYPQSVQEIFNLNNTIQWNFLLCHWLLYYFFLLLLCFVLFLLVLFFLVRFQQIGFSSPIWLFNARR